jgi:hypothetical protein
VQKHNGRKKEYLQEAVIFAATTKVLPRQFLKYPFFENGRRCALRK